MSNSLTRLRKLFEEFKRIPFPRGAVTDELNEIHGEVAEYDGYIAGLITTLLSRQSIPSGSLFFDAKIQGRLNAIVEQGDLQASEAAKIYLDYLGKLKELIDLGNEIVESEG